MPTSHKAKMTFEQPVKEIEGALKYALHKLRIPGTRPPGKEIRIFGNTLMNIWSWGESIEIEIFESGVVEIASKCKQRIFCGMNKRNVEGIFNHMNEYFQGYRIFD